MPCCRPAQGAAVCRGGDLRVGGVCVGASGSTRSSRALILPRHVEALRRCAIVPPGAEVNARVLDQQVVVRVEKPITEARKVGSSASGDGKKAECGTTKSWLAGPPPVELPF
eukprot:5585943-Prymnesium_polylepis.1